MSDSESIGHERPDRGHQQLSPEQREAIAGRLREALSSFDLEPDRKAKIPPRTMRRYRTGAVPELPGLLAIADATGVSMEWLLNGRGPKVVTTNYDALLEKAVGTPRPGGTRQYVPIPRLNIQASAGYGALAEHGQVVEYLAFDLDFIRTRLRRDPAQLVLIEARGDSMEPTISDGDVLTIDIRPHQALESGCLYVLQVGDSLLVKRVELRIDSIVLHSDNARYTSEIITRDKADQLGIVGQVILITAPPR